METEAKKRKKFGRGNLRDESEHALLTTGHPLYKNERQALIQIAKTWKGHRGVNFKTTTSENIYLLIMDARSHALRSCEQGGDVAIAGREK